MELCKVSWNAATAASYQNRESRGFEELAQSYVKLARDVSEIYGVEGDPPGSIESIRGMRLEIEGVFDGGGQSYHDEIREMTEMMRRFGP